jgi:hypothetical protein
VKSHAAADRLGVRLYYALLDSGLEPETAGRVACEVQMRVERESGLGDRTTADNSGKMRVTYGYLP